ncbi:2-succinyl-6-hydroxy-2,4-cyclohexadiene-1-carboxylate synthase [Sporolactobacillus sp. CPB3-1]|uniref:Putative 2-succinyl-6-hydroxy-2,4-cyclohexadiene-1-carboxylate synthase n=1 Tax=Sporolactobacillus mangiferae TaxID=2940498 RepID=A0ABT0MBM6_9BACL|nr:2-succinyl-6-hydroxy-2,4-cyclohexadiene-1-carboxylate synthase [Sporolactobacillus mangiferae]MCL1631750.1 2-succinyl-6-hydroxy-2,4-cyclohexadiene-1-carboxylate synthase [Sporolactobacillus mangiferae]
MMTELRGTVYHFEQRGAGFPMLLLHGFTGSVKTWDFLDTAFFRGFRLIAPDIIGHGQTGKPADFHRYSIFEAAKDLCALLDFLNIDRVLLLGYSMGGRLALSFACLYPERTAGLILESASPGLKTEKERKSRRIKDELLAEALVSRGVQAFVARWEQLPLFESQKSMSPEVRAALRAQRLANDANGLACSLRGMGTGAQPSWWAHLPDLRMPTLMITGAIDKKFCVIASEMQKRVPYAEWRTILDSGHAVHLERPKSFMNLVRSYAYQCAERSDIEGDTR